jgi:hypothetical protein
MTRGLFALGAASLLGVLSWVAEESTLWLFLLFPAMAMAATAALGSDIPFSVSPRRLLERAVRGIVIVGIVAFSWSMFAEVDPHSPLALFVWVALAAVMGASALLMSRPGGGPKVSIIFFVTYALSVWWVLSVRHPFIDVVMFQQQASAAVAEGISPYSITFLDHYGSSSEYFYGPGVSVDGVLQFGFPYLPLSLLAVAPFELLFSDFRAAHAIALLAAGVLISRLGSGWIAKGSAAGFLLLTPVLNIVLLGWTEPLLVLGLVVILYLHGRSSRSIPYVLGLVVAVKQYAVLLLPSSLLLRERPWSMRSIGRDLIKTVVVVAVVTLPFFIWDPGGFYHSVVELQFLQPFRFDAISFPALWADHFGEPPTVITTLLPIAGVALVTAMTWIRTPTGAQGYALASALTLFVFFSLSKQAFSNYYLVVLALLFSAAAIADTTAAEDTKANDISSSLSAP